MADYAPIVKKSFPKMVAILNVRGKGITKSGTAL